MDRMKKSIFFGVEGGGTKSTAILVDEHSNVLNRFNGGALNYNALGVDKVERELKKLLAPVIRHTKKTKDTDVYGVFGFAGLNTEKDRKEYEKIVRKVVPSSYVWEACNDTKIALEAACEGDNRILVVSGTGSNIYGESGRKKAKAGGWDFIVADEGSAFGTGMLALRAAVRSWDGRIPKNVFEKLFPKYLKVSSMENVIEYIYKVWKENPDKFKYIIASFSPIVDQALVMKDREAIRIREDAVKELSLGVETVAKKLNLGEKNVCIGMVGSHWEMPGLSDKFIKQVKNIIPHSSFSTRGKQESIFGAIRMAKELKLKK